MIARQKVGETKKVARNRSLNNGLNIFRGLPTKHRPGEWLNLKSRMGGVLGALLDIISHQDTREWV